MKPENKLVSDDELICKVADFGLAHVLDSVTNLVLNTKYNAVNELKHRCVEVAIFEFRESERRKRCH